MNWTKKDWIKEDIEFQPKRKINNKKSKYIHHISGYLYSQKLKRNVGYESLWGECLFFYYLELDKSIIRYYEQPVEVPIISINDTDKELKKWIHIPDVLVYREGNNPCLIQVKDTKKNINISNTIYKNCTSYASKRGWDYIIVTPKDLPDVIKSNILFLWNYIKPRRKTGVLINEVIYKMKYLNSKDITIHELAKSFSSKVDYRLVLPVIYHLISTGELFVNITEQIRENSVIKLGNINSILINLIDIKGDS